MGSINTGEHWYAGYTRPRSEKAVAAQLAKLGIEHYLPLVKTLRQWSDRKKKVEVPLFSSYIFVKTDYMGYYKALNVPGMVKFIHFEGKAATLSDKAIEDIHRIVQSGYAVEETEQSFEPGEAIRVIQGPLKGMTGEMVKFKGKSVVLIHLDDIKQSLTVEIPAVCLAPVNRVKSEKLKTKN